MASTDRFGRLLRGTDEVVTRQDLAALLERGGTPRAYVGLEPSGLIHIGMGFIVASKLVDLVDAGFHVTILLADWHAFVNDKLGGNLKAIQLCAEYFKDAFRALGVPDEVEYRTATQVVAEPDYWMDVLRVSKAASLARIRRALTIMGRKEDDADLDASKLVYPAMQVTDIHRLDLDLALGGMDQRHAHMLYRDLAPKLGWKQIVALHTPLLPGLQGGARMDPVDAKMSKSRPDSSILINDSVEDVDWKIAKAYCPPRETEDNPILAIAKHVLFPRTGSLTVSREAKYGGDATYESFAQLGRAYGRGDLHPKDLKAAVAAALNRELDPVRAYFEAQPANLAAFRKATAP